MDINHRMVKHMIKNLEISIYKPNEIYEPVDFNPEFASVAYYYFLKIKKIKIANCSYIKILITNDKKKRKWHYKIFDGILFIDGSRDFSSYQLFSKREKSVFQYRLVYSILKEVFINYQLEVKILDEINDELAVNGSQMKYEYLKKRIEKGKEFKLQIYMDIDSFTFIGEIIHNGEKKEVQIFKSIPTYFAIDYLFKGYRFFDNKVRIGSKEKAVFELDMDTGIVKIVDIDNKMLIKLGFK